MVVVIFGGRPFNPSGATLEYLLAQTKHKSKINERTTTDSSFDQVVKFYENPFDLRPDNKILLKKRKNQMKFLKKLCFWWRRQV